MISVTHKNNFRGLFPPLENFLLPTETAFSAPPRLGSSGRYPMRGGRGMRELHHAPLISKVLSNFENLPMVQQLNHQRVLLT